MKNVALLVIIAALGLAYGLMQGQVGESGEFLAGLLRVILVVSVTVLLVRLVDYLLIDILLVQLKGRNISQLLHHMVSVLLYGAASLLILHYVFHTDLLALLTASALITVVIGYSLRMPLSHVFSGIFMQMEQPMQIGDLVRVGDRWGVIRALDWRSASLRSSTGSTLVLPNSSIADKPVEVFRPGYPIAQKVKLTAPNEIPPQKITAMVDEIIRSMPEINHTRRHYNRMISEDHFNGIINFEATCYPKEYTRSPAIAAVIIERLWYACARETARTRVRETPLDEDLRQQREFLLGRVPALRLLSREDRVVLAEYAVSLLYAQGEQIVTTGPAAHSLFVLARGMVSISGHCLAGTNEINEATGPEPGVCDDGAADIIIRKLTNYIGPVARLLVQARRKVVQDLHDLYQQLSEHIPDPGERQEFLRGAPACAATQLTVGMSFGANSAFSGSMPTPERRTAVGETELLEINATLIRRLLCNNHDTDDLIHRISRVLVTENTQDVERCGHQAELHEQQLIIRMKSFLQLS